MSAERVSVLCKRLSWFPRSVQGLVVPVIRNVETMNFADIEKTINALGEKVKTHKIFSYLTCYYTFLLKSYLFQK